MQKHQAALFVRQSKITQWQFDDLETFEHTKCKPLSITLAVEAHTRIILGFEVAQMPANGPLALISKKKYGCRADHRPMGRARLFLKLRGLVDPCSQVKSDKNPHYPADIKKFFPLATHTTVKGRRGAITGQGELKKIGFDPIFSLNHTCASFRANMNRLFRKTWCTTKSRENLYHHLAIYAQFHNEMISLKLEAKKRKKRPKRARSNEQSRKVIAALGNKSTLWSDS